MLISGLSTDSEVTVEETATDGFVTSYEVEVTKDGNTWTYTWSGMPKLTSTGEEIEYYVTEAAVEGHTTTVTLAAMGYRRRRES